MSHFKFIKTLILLTVFLCSTLFADDHAKKQKAVLVTGASSGIGLNITEHLVKAGYYVYAGARKEADLKRLDAMENVSSVKVDVTKPDEIAAAVKFVESQGRGLYGLINNAGVGVFNRMSEVPLDEISWIHDVNVLGPHRMNMAFLPMLKASKGRTAVISSISGYLTGANGGAYSMSKFAVEAYTESLAADLAESGVKVATIAPGGYKSKIREKVVTYSLTGNYKVGAELTEEQQKALDDMKAQNDALKDPDEVSEATLSFLNSDNPRIRYMVVPNEQQANITVRTAIRRALQLNADQPYELSRDELVALVDELLKEGVN